MRIFPSRASDSQPGNQTKSKRVTGVQRVWGEVMAGGRPRLEIEWEAFDALCAVQCTLAEIAAYLGVSEDTIERAVKREQGMSFADYFAQKRQAGFVSLRRKQFELAMEGNPTMLIFLGKQWLGQSDRRENNAQEVEARVTVICDI
jgi:hypothetical protein